MIILPEAFLILTSIGLWKSNKWETWKCILYYSYTLFLAYHFITFFCFGLLGLIFFCTNIIDLVTNSSIIITMFTVPGKMIAIINNRKKILSFMKDLQRQDFKPRNQQEQDMCNRWNKFIRLNTWVYVVFVQISAIFFDITKIYDSQQSGSLPFKIWYPYNTKSPIIHSFTSYQQVITVFMCANVHVAFDALLLGMMIQICLQVNILKHRFQIMLNKLEEYNDGQDKIISTEQRNAIEKIFFSDYITFHSTVLRLVDNMTDIFSRTMFVQFVSSSLIFCTSIYVLSQTPLFTSEFIACLAYILCMFFQIFLPCFIGNQMTIEFAGLNNAMYNTNWYSLGYNVRKYMNFIMIRSSKPIVFSSGYIIALSLDAFKHLLKLSYTIFNVFQKSS